MTSTINGLPGRAGSTYRATVPNMGGTERRSKGGLGKNKFQADKVRLGCRGAAIHAGRTVPLKQVPLALLQRETGPLSGVRWYDAEIFCTCKAWRLCDCQGPQGEKYIERHSVQRFPMQCPVVAVSKLLTGGASSLHVISFTDTAARHESGLPDG